MPHPRPCMRARRAEESSTMRGGAAVTDGSSTTTRGMAVDIQPRRSGFRNCAPLIGHAPRPPLIARGLRSNEIDLDAAVLASDPRAAVRHGANGPGGHRPGHRTVGAGHRQQVVEMHAYQVARCRRAILLVGESDAPRDPCSSCSRWAKTHCLRQRRVSLRTPILDSIGGLDL